MALLAGAFVGLTLALETEIARDLLPVVLHEGSELSDFSAAIVPPLARGGWWLAVVAAMSPLLAVAALRRQRVASHAIIASVLAVSFAWLCIAVLAAGGLFALFNHGIRLAP